MLEEIEEWATRPATDLDEPIFHLTGAPGSGKSTIAYEIARRSDKNNLPVVSYIYRGDDVTHDFYFFHSCITWQLAVSMPSLRPHFVEAARDVDYEAYETERVIREAFRKLNAKTETVPPILVIVDFFDLADDTLTGWADRIQDMAKNATPIALRFLITSRMSSRLKEKVGVRTFDMQYIPRGDGHADSTLYLKNALGKRQWHGTLLNARPDALKHLTEIANDSFFSASTALRFLDADPDNVIRSFDTLSPRYGGDGSAESRELDKLYAFVLDNVRYGRFEGHDLRKILSSIALLQGNLALGEVCSLLSISQETALSLISPLRWFLVYSPDMGIKVHPGHACFVEFLTDRQRCADDRFYIDPPDGHTILASECLMTVIERGVLHRNICNLPGPSAVKAEIDDLQSRIQRNVSPHVRYACLHWPTHLFRSEPRERSMYALKAFCMEKMLYWLEALSLLGELGIAPDQLAAVHVWYQGCETVSLNNTL